MQISLIIMSKIIWKKNDSIIFETLIKTQIVTCCALFHSQTVYYCLNVTNAISNHSGTNHYLEFWRLFVYKRGWWSSRLMSECSKHNHGPWKIITWKRVPHYCPFVTKTHRWLVDSLHNKTELSLVLKFDVFLFCPPGALKYSDNCSNKNMIFKVMPQRFSTIFLWQFFQPHFNGHPKWIFWSILYQTF